MVAAVGRGDEVEVGRLRRLGASASVQLALRDEADGVVIVPDRQRVDTGHQVHIACPPFAV